MQLSISTKILKAALATVSKAVNNKTPLPILTHLLLEASHGQLAITGHDLDVGMRITVEADVQAAGAVTMSAAQLSSLAGLASAKSIIIETLSEGRALVRSEGDGKIARWEIGTLPADEYPNVPVVDGHQFIISAAALGNAIEEAGVAVAADKNEARLVMTGLCIDAADGVLTCVGCDGRRLAVAQRAIEFQGELPRSVLPMRTLSALAKELGSEGDVRVYMTDRKAFFQAGNKLFWGSLIEGTFPEWTKVMPGKDAFRWTVRADRKLLIDTIRGALVMAKSKRSPNLLRINVGEEVLAIDASTPDLGQASMTMKCQGWGEANFPVFGVNGQYLLDALSAIETQHVLWEMQDALKSSILRPDDDTSFRYVVMPVRLADVKDGLAA